jgi:hypothetical protein
MQPPRLAFAVLFVAMCMAVTGCVVRTVPASPPGIDARLKATDGSVVNIQRIDCPVHCTKRGTLVTCQADCPPLAITDQPPAVGR